MMMTRLGTWRIAFWALAALLAVGCGHSGPKLYQVSGKVTFKGQPVAAGWVTFTPDHAKGNDGPDRRARISGGSYDTAGADGAGTVGGPMIVRVQGFDGQKTADLPDGKAIFAPYDTAVELPRENTKGHDLTVPDSQANQPVPVLPP
jgi:hypothetical protein